MPTSTNLDLAKQSCFIVVPHTQHHINPMTIKMTMMKILMMIMIMITMPVMMMMTMVFFVSFSQDIFSAEGKSFPRVKMLRPVTISLSQYDGNAVTVHSNFAV